MEALACSSTDSKSATAFDLLPRPLQVQWIMNSDPVDFASLTFNEQQQWITFTLKFLKSSGELCKICDYLEMKHDCYNLKKYGLDLMLAAFIQSEQFDIDDGRHAIMLIFQAIQESFEVGYHCRRVISEEDNLMILDDLEYTLYILRSFYDAVKDVVISDVRYALASHIAHLSTCYDSLTPEDTETSPVESKDEQLFTEEEPSILELEDEASGIISLDLTQEETTLVCEKGLPIDQQTVNNDEHKIISYVHPTRNPNDILLRTSILFSCNNIFFCDDNHWVDNAIRIDVWYLYQLYVEHKHIHVQHRDRHTVGTS